MTRQEFRSKLVVLRDELLELNKSYIELYDAGEIPKDELFEDSLYEHYVRLEEFIRRIPYDNLIAKLLAK